MLTSLDLFSGIGGFALGFDRAGIGTTAFCEIDPYARRVLSARFPKVPVYDDVRTLNVDRLRADGIALPDIICGGFPCQDISLAGRGAGLAGERSGLWWEFHRLVAEARPRFVVAENVSALRSRGLDEVLRSLDAIGYDAEWHCVPAAAVGAPHRRDRIWIVAYPHRVSGYEGRPGDPSEGEGERHADRGCLGAPLPHADGGRRYAGEHQVCSGEPNASRRGADLADTDEPRLEVLLDGNAGELAAAVGASPWAAEPDVGRVAYGVPSRVDRLRCLGNAVVPIIPEIIGRAIVRRAGGVA